MKDQNLYNLDDESEVNEFISLYGGMSPRMIAFRLGFKGKGAHYDARNLRNYAWNKVTAMNLRKQGNIDRALVYEQICDKIYNGMSENLKW